MNKQAYTMNKQDFNFPRQRNKFLFWLQQSLWMCPSWEWICIILKIFTYFWPPGWKAIYPLYDKCHQRDRITAINNKGWTDYFLQSFFLAHYESKIKGKLEFFNLIIYLEYLKSLTTKPSCEKFIWMVQEDVFFCFLDTDSIFVWK